MAIMVAIGALAGCGEAGAAITRLAVGEPGPDAYTLVSGVDDPQVTRRADAGGAREGDQPGLYGGTRKAAGCDKDKLVKFLGDHPDKAEAWAGVHHVTPAEIPAFVGKLTPVVLRVDTLVTNHGYRGGEATSIPAVLQAGVGVLVDAHGLPVVKCNCGNPLTAPDRKIDLAESSYQGTKWPQFSQKKITVIEAPAQEVKSLVLVDPDLGMVFTRPTGTEGESDGAPAPMPPEAMPEPSATPGGGSQAPSGDVPSALPSDTPGGSDDPSPKPEPTSQQPAPDVTREPVETAAPRSAEPEPEHNIAPPEEPKAEPAADPTPT